MSASPVGSGSLRRRAARGAVFVGIRGIASRIFALAGLVILARSLRPSEFGAFALGTVLMTSVSMLTQSGVGAGLIRREQDPQRAELQVVVGVNLAATVFIGAAAAAIGNSISQAGLVVGLMLSCLVLTAFRAPAAILLERKLDYRRLAGVEIFESLSFYGVSVLGVAFGAGLWAAVAAAFVRAAGGTALLLAAASAGRVRPSLHRETLRSLISFGATYQAVVVANFGRDQGMHLGIAAIAGVASLGAYTIAQRVLQVPAILFEALFRVSYPAMSRLLESGERARELIERAIAAVALAAGATITPLAASSPALIPLLFGSRWEEAVPVVPAVGFGLMIGAPVAVATAGYLYAVGDAQTVLRSALLHSVAWFAVTLPLLRPLGIVAAGLGIIASSLTEAAVLGRRARQRSGAVISAGLRAPLSGAVLGTAAGLGLLRVLDGPGLVEVLAAAGAGELVYVAVVWSLDRVRARETTLAAFAALRHPAEARTA